MRKNKALGKLAVGYTLLFWLSGNIGILRMINYFLPDWLWLFDPLILCLSAGAIYYALLPEIDWEKKWKEKNYECMQLKKTVERAIDRKDITVLFPLCDPEWIKVTQETSYFWELDRIVKEYNALKIKVPFTPEHIGKFNPYTNTLIQTESDYNKYLWACAKDVLARQQSQQRTNDK